VADVLPNVANLEVESLARLFKALADETRVRIIALLTHGELCVCHLEAALGLSQPTASRHLSLLRTSGLVTSKRVGTWVYYRLADQDEDACRRVLAAIRTLAAQDTLRRDLARLRKTTGPGSNCD
jgi:ArsR family transcriptional regulator